MLSELYIRLHHFSWHYYIHFFNLYLKRKTLPVSLNCWICWSVKNIPISRRGIATGILTLTHLTFASFNLWLIITLRYFYIEQAIKNGHFLTFVFRYEINLLPKENSFFPKFSQRAAFAFSGYLPSSAPFPGNRFQKTKCVNYKCF